mgnify:CR=1 FL=1
MSVKILSLTCIHPVTGMPTEAFRCNKCDEVKPMFMRGRSHKTDYCKKCAAQMRASAPSGAMKWAKREREMTSWKKA